MAVLVSSDEAAAGDLLPGMFAGPESAIPAPSCFALVCPVSGTPAVGDASMAVGSGLSVAKLVWPAVVPGKVAVVPGDVAFLAEGPETVAGVRSTACLFLL